MEELLEFLSVPLYDGTAIFEKFAALPGAVYRQGQSKLQRFVYVPGTRKDRIVLIAHADTVWDDAYAAKRLQTVLKVDSQIISSGQDAGIGADDRAGCALLWKLRNFGHSLLLVDGEEHGHHGALFLQNQHPAVFRELNRHSYMMQLDLWGKGFCMYHKIPNSTAFCQYIEQGLSLKPLDKKSGTDVSYLCRQACGVNISVGYQRFHTSREWIDGNTWQQIAADLETFLAKPQPKFRTRFLKQMKLRIKDALRKVYRFLKNMGR